MKKTKAFSNTQPSFVRLRSIYAERTNRILFWCGAGLSKPVAPDWSELRQLLTEAADEKFATLEPGEAARNRKELEAIEEERDPWVAFERLKRLMGDTTYRTAVRSALDLPDAVPPEAYKQLWSIRIAGMVTLNVDRFAARSYAATRGQDALEMTGWQLGPMAGRLKSAPNFIINMHGLIEDHQSWVLTHSELKALQSQPSYKSAIQILFGAFSVVFIGITADDAAAGGTLAALTEQGISLDDHFWITSRRDRATGDWAEKAGIQVIRYNPDIGHSAAMHEILSALENFTPIEESLPPVVPSHAPTHLDLPPPEQLAVQNPEVIRVQLASYTAQLFSGNASEAVLKYRTFCRDYARAIYNSWFVRETPPDNTFFGHAIERHIGDGAFGVVYKAKSPEGNHVAIKVLRQEVEQDEVMLGSFRRGVNSMRILTAAQIPGVVKILEAYELPPTIVMEYVDGINLEDAVHARLDPLWQSGLNICTSIAKILRSGHMLPERVLHRDLRPANVMLTNYYSGDLGVCVLDFDLSWHKGALEKSISTHASSALGYLAPEQLDPSKKVTTRSTAVDSYGLAATLYFVFTGRHPRAGEFSQEGWPDELFRRLPSSTNELWQSLRNRVHRLILAGTVVYQPRRADMAEMESELERLYQASFSPSTVMSCEMWAEELMCRSYPGPRYEFDADTRSCRIMLLSGTEVTLTPREVAQEIELQVTYSEKGDHDRRNIGRFIADAADRAVALLKAGDWVRATCSGRDTAKSQHMTTVSARIALRNVRDDIERVVSQLDKVIQEFRFE